MVTKCLNNPRIKVGDGASGSGRTSCRALFPGGDRGPQHSQESHQESHQESLAQFMVIVN